MTILDEIKLELELRKEYIICFITLRDLCAGMYLEPSISAGITRCNMLEAPSR